MRYFNASVFQQFEKYLGMFLLIVGRFQKDSGNLFVPGLLGYAGKVGVCLLYTSPQTGLGSSLLSCSLVS